MYRRFRFWLRNYFGFSKSESNGFVILIPLTLCIIIAPVVWRHSLVSSQNNWENSEADSLIALIESRIKVKKFERKYSGRSKYRKPKSVKKKRDYHKPKKTFSPVKKPLTRFDLNEADTTTLKKVYGIGPVLSSRIIKFRELLGGFTHKTQLTEVYGLKDSTLTRLDSLSFIAKDFIPLKVDVNNSVSYVLDDHPYISRKLADVIDNYRYQHGAIDSVEVLYEMHLVDSATVEKVYPYLKF